MSSGLDRGRGLGFDFQVTALAEPSRTPAQEIADSLFLCYTSFGHRSGRNGWGVDVSAQQRVHLGSWHA